MYVVVADVSAERKGSILLMYPAVKLRGRVVAWGPDTTELKNGDDVVYRQHIAAVDIGGKEWLLVREDDVLARVG